VITLIHGSESYLVDKATRELLLPLRTGLTLEFNYEDIQADALNADGFAEKAGTLPFIDTLRVLVLRDWGLLAGKRDKGAGPERAAAYLEGIPDTTHLVLVTHVLVTPGNPIYKVVAAMERDKRARIQRYEPPRRSDRAGWFFACLAIGPVALFALLGFWTPVLPHWPMLGWLFAFPLLGCALARLEITHGRGLRRAVGVSSSILIALLTLAAAQASTGWASGG